MSEPLMSPDAARFATAEPIWGDCAGTGTSLDVWRMTDTVPVHEWHVAPWDCRAPTGWWPSDVHWLTPDTLEFIHHDAVPADLMTDSTDSTDSNDSNDSNDSTRRRPMRAVYDRGNWRIVPAPPSTP
ncbi:MAG TPA: hypothetical protein VK636_16055 [Gemmatimonadaceae bacterium]|nr:hypothetical protein [Gemmatimonadaceae bacterium]